VAYDDPILDELSIRCHRLLDTRILIVEYDMPSPFSELRLGPVRVLRRDAYLAVFLDHLVYTMTDDMVFAGKNDSHHLFSRWPHVCTALGILRAEMVLDDLASA